MRRQKLLWQLYPSFFIVIFVALAAFIWIESVDRAGAGPLAHFFFALGIAGLVALFLGKLLIDIVRRPIVDIRRGVEQFVKGELSGRLYISDPDEFAALASSLNRVGLQLEERLRTVLSQRNERDAIFAGMREGVMVLDGEQRVIRLNSAAETLLGIRQEKAAGKTIFEVVRNNSLQRLLADALRSDMPVQGIVSLFDPEERITEVYARTLPEAPREGPMILVVFNDVTHVRRLENVRRDFVANVSHELKTPVTAIKGFVETLQDGAVEDTGQAKHFLQIISRQVERLSNIFDDLLSLSHIEQGGEKGTLEFRNESLREILEGAVAAYRSKAEQKQIEISVESVDAALSVSRNLIEQAVGNLVDNAIKMSDAGKRVWVSASEHGDRLVIEVRDEGPGITAEHLPRIFERFYRVDRGRSRAQGGTGLGLAIVKHIAQAHGGAVRVESVYGSGSSFFIDIPLVSEK